MLVGALNLSDAGTTHVGNCTEVHTARNPLRYHVVPETVGYDVSGFHIPNLADSTIRLKCCVALT